MNTLKFYLLFLSFLTTTIAIQGQTDTCNIVYDSLEVKPKYGNIPSSLYNYISNELIPPIVECATSNKDMMIASLFVTLTINKTGKVIDVAFTTPPQLTSDCKKVVIAKLLTMKGWTPGEKDKMRVCSKYKLDIQCIMLQEK